MKQRCASANLLFLAGTFFFLTVFSSLTHWNFLDACTCSTATTCDAMRLASACAGIKNAQPNVASCICEVKRQNDLIEHNQSVFFLNRLFALMVRRQAMLLIVVR